MKNRANPFQHVKTARVRRSFFNNSHFKLLNADMGQLIPVMCMECIPGDMHKMTHSALIRMNPMIFPVMGSIKYYVHYFFVPYRLLWSEWEEYITRGVTGDDNTPVPEWIPTNTAKYSLWDYLGFPVNIDPQGAYPVNFPRLAYNTIYNEYYRDQNFIPEKSENNEDILYRAWSKDYFTSALPWQQRGTAPAIPIQGLTSAVWEQSTFDTINPSVTPSQLTFQGDYHGDSQMHITGGSGPATLANAKLAFDNNTVDLSTAGAAIDVSDQRLLFATQKYLERNARAGARYTEWLHVHYGQRIRDSRLDRAEYIGGMVSPITVSEVLQTSSTDGTSPQGNLAGHGISAPASRVGTYKVPEYGLIMGIMSIIPTAGYSQGINKQWLKKDDLEYPHPEFLNLSEQEILNAEIMASNQSTTNNGIFGFQGRFDEYRVQQNQFVADMRDTLKGYHLGREFVPGAPPVLGPDFIECKPRKDIFAVPSEPGFIIQAGNIVQSWRPLPYIAEPKIIGGDEE